MIKYSSDYYEPQEFKGKWQTQCQACEWVSDTITLYPDECDIYNCPECNSDDIVDVNVEEEND